ncbi:hypothetical protein BDN72DRAFT_740265, partial [Pluteus cervinus]
PPVWVEIPSDQKVYTRQKPICVPPPIIPLDEHSSCPCNETRTFYSPSNPSFTRPCTIFTLTGALTSTIELQQCPSAAARQNRFIGPDPRHLGIFNFNNSLLFTHDLLDDYTNSYTKSEMPFASWVSILADRYVAHQSPVAFVSDQILRNVWFSFINLQ